MPVDEAVCIVSGPYLTHDMYKSLEQPADIHVVPSLFCLTVQYPHISFNTGLWWDKPYNVRNFGIFRENRHIFVFIIISLQRHYYHIYHIFISFCVILGKFGKIPIFSNPTFRIELWYIWFNKDSLLRYFVTLNGYHYRSSYDVIISILGNHENIN